MPTVVSTASSAQTRNFALRAVAWSLALFGLLRLPTVERLLILPLTQWQGRLAAGLFGTPLLPIDVTLACSGADAIALCSGFILAFPAPWRGRMGAAAGGFVLILALNTLRIGTLGRATEPAWFDALHLYLWPTLLILATAGYVFRWMRRVEAPHPSSDSPGRSFALLSALLLVIFTAGGPLYLESAGVLLVAGFMAQSAAGILDFLGMQATAAANVLYTGRGGFLVTRECISTPLIPIYIAAVIVYARSTRMRLGLLLAAIPLFVALGTARLLVVALPAAFVETPLVLVHAFYQLLMAGVIVCLAAVWRHGPGRVAGWHAAAATAVGTVCLAALWPHSTPLLAATFPAAVSAADPQGAMALLPPFQLALYGALCVGLSVAGRWRLCAAGLAVLCVSQVAGFALLDLLQRHAGVAPHVGELRAWALAAPLLLVFAMVRYDPPRR